jgi:4,5-DOPA dioxygenase extradiol
MPRKPLLHPHLVIGLAQPAEQLVVELLRRADAHPVPVPPAAEVLDLADPILDDESWGLDHGTWSVLGHVFPDADIPVVQLSVDETQPPSFHYELGGNLAPLRDEGVLVIGSSNLVHNLHAYSWGRRPVEPFEWAVRFETEVRRLLEGHEHGPLVDYESLGPDALLSIHTPDHYLPLLYVIAGCTGDDITYPVEGIDGGSISMLTVRLG